MITVKQLRYFDALAQTHHFGRAADLCSVTQPALSMQIKELEALLGEPLIERTSSGALLTPLGEDVARRSASILSDIREISALAKPSATPLTGALKLGIIPTVAPYLLTAIIAHCRKDYPQLALSVREAQTDDVVQELRHGALDAIVIALPHAQDDFSETHVFDDRFFLALPRTSGSVDQVISALDLMAQNTMLLLEEGHCFRDQALEVCSLRPEGKLDIFGANNLGTIARMVEAGMGATLLPELSLHVEAGSANLRLMQFDDPMPARKIGLCWRTSSSRRADFDALAALLTEAGEEVKALYDAS